MTDIPHIIQNFGIKYEQTEGVDPIIADEDYYKIGLYNTSWGKFPIVKYDAYQQWFNDYQAEVLHISKASIIGQLTNLPINGLGLYLILSKDGSGVSILNSVKTITPPSVETQSFTARFESSDVDGNGIFKSVTGSRMMSYSESIDLQNPNMFLSSVFSFQSKNIANSAVLTNKSPVNPGTVELPYKKDSNTNITFDSVDITKYVLNYTHTIETFNRFTHLKDDVFPSFLKNGTRTYTMGLTMWRTETTDAIYENFVSQTRDGTYPSMSFKIYQDANHYRKHSFSKVVPISIDMNHANINNQEKATYTITAVVIPECYEIYDDLANSFYGVS